MSPVRSAVRLLVVLGLVFGLRYGDRIPVPIPGRMSGHIALVGCVLCVVGVAFAIWARLAIGSNCGMPMTLAEQPELVTSGPYAFVRHPIYTGVSLLWIGTALVYPLTIVPGAAFIAYCVVSAYREEADMGRLFPDVYPAYKKRTKRLVPFLW